MFCSLSIGSASETYFVVVPDNVDQLNDPAADYWFEPKCNIMMSGTFDLRHGRRF